MTIREAFSKLYGEIPEDATCHIGYEEPYDSYIIFRPIIKVRHPLTRKASYKLMEGFGGRWMDVGFMPYMDGFCAVGPDLSDRPASAFLGFFGKEFDDFVEENKDEEID